MENEAAPLLLLILLLCAALVGVQAQLNDLRARIRRVEMENYNRDWRDEESDDPNS